MPDPDPREGLDPQHPGGLIEGGQADIPGVQGLGPADADAKSEQAAEGGTTGGGGTPAGDVPPADED